MKSKRLNNGDSIPVIGFGTYLLNGSEGTRSIIEALEQGYRLIDTAAKYGNEEEVGMAIRESGVKREDVFVTSKVWRDQLGYQSTRKSFDESLERLNLDYLDLFLVHWPANANNFDDWKKVNLDTWRALEELHDEGRVRAIGVSNFLTHHLEALLAHARIMPAVNQIEFHPGYWQPETAALCRENEIAVEAWSPFARGDVFENETLKQIAKNHGKSIAQVCLRWAVQHDAIVIPKSSTPDRIRENLEIFDFELSADEMKRIDNLPEMGFSGEHPDEWTDFF